MSETEIILANYQGMEEKKILLTESNVLDVYKKLVGNEEISREELEAVKKRFYELVDATH